MPPRNMDAAAAIVLCGPSDKLCQGDVWDGGVSEVLELHVPSEIQRT